MKIRTTAALTAALLLGTASAALAQDQNQGRHDWNHGEDHRGGPPPQQRPPQAPRPAPPPASGQNARPQGDRHDWGGRPWNGGQGDRHDWRGPPPGANNGGQPGQGYRPQGGPWNGQGGDHGWRGPPPGANNGPPQGWQGGRDGGHDRYSGGGGRWWGGDGDHRDRPQWRPGYFPPAFRADHRFRIGPYFPPPGWTFRAWGYGEILPQAWWAPRYRILDWWDYELPVPPPGFLWVRSGPDALLIDPYGRIVQVVDTVFW